MSENYNIELYFPTPIYNVENMFSKEQNVKWADELLKVKENNPIQSTYWPGDTYTTCGPLHDGLKENEIFYPLNTIVKDHVNNFAAQHDANQGLVCKESWANISLLGNFQEFHCHEGRIISGIYYVKTPEGSGPLVFNNPRGPDMMPLIRKNSGNPTDILSTKRIIITPKEGMLILFRSYLEHMVLPNKNTDPRISISFNFSYDSY